MVSRFAHRHVREDFDYLSCHPPAFTSSGSSTKAVVSMCRRASQPLRSSSTSTRLSTVMNAPDNHGFEAWRSLTNHCEPAAANRFCGLQRELSHPIKPTSKGFVQFLEKCVTQVTKYESQSKEEIGNHIRIGIVTDVAPP